jgi:quinol monooxygenase YgiN
MRLFRPVLLAMALAPLAAVPSAMAQSANDSASYIVSYIEVMPTAMSQAPGLLRLLADASRKEAGAQRFQVLQRAAPSNHFAILEVWKDQQALDAHTGAAHTKQFRDRLQPLLVAPIDDRLCIAMEVGAIEAVRGARPRYVVTHVDIGPPNPTNRDNAIPVLKAFSATSRQEAGNQRFDLLQQKMRTNHFEVVEVWKDQKSDNAHELAAHTKEFRAKLAPVIGALYDQRWYKAL